MKLSLKFMTLALVFSSGLTLMAGDFSYGSTVGSDVDLNKRVTMLERYVKRMILELRDILNKPDFADPEGKVKKDNADTFSSGESRDRYKPWKRFKLLDALNQASPSRGELQPLENIDELTRLPF